MSGHLCPLTSFKIVHQRKMCRMYKFGPVQRLAYVPWGHMVNQNLSATQRSTRKGCLFGVFLLLSIIWRHFTKFFVKGMLYFFSSGALECQITPPLLFPCPKMNLCPKMGQIRLVCRHWWPLECYRCCNFVCLFDKFAFPKIFYNVKGLWKSRGLKGLCKPCRAGKSCWI